MGVPRAIDYAAKTVPSSSAEHSVVKAAASKNRPHGPVLAHSRVHPRLTSKLPRADGHGSYGILRDVARSPSLLVICAVDCGGYTGAGWSTSRARRASCRASAAVPPPSAPRRARPARTPTDPGQCTSSICSPGPAHVGGDGRLSAARDAEAMAPRCRSPIFPCSSVIPCVSIFLPRAASTHAPSQRGSARRIDCADDGPLNLRTVISSTRRRHSRASEHVTPRLMWRAARSDIPRQPISASTAGS